MPTLREIITRIGFNVDTRSLSIYDKAIERVYAKTDKMYRNLNRVADGMVSIGSKMTLGLTLPIAAIGTVSVMAASKVEDIRTSFDVLLGSAEKANILMEDLFKFEAKTPFNLEDVMQFANTLVMMKVPLDKMTDTLTMLGEATGGRAPAMEGVLAQLFQVKNLGYASLQDIKPITNWGIPIIEALGKVMNTDAKGVMKAISTQQVSYDILMKGMAQIGKERTGLMARQSQTITGLMSTIQSGVFKLRAGLGDMIVDTFKLQKIMQKIINFLEKIVEGMKKMSPWQRRILVGFGLMLAAIGPLLVAMGSLAKLMFTISVSMSALKFLGIAGGIKGLIPLLGKLSLAAMGITLQIALWAVALGLVFLLVEDIVAYFQGRNSLIIPGWIAAWKEMFNWLSGTWYGDYADWVWGLTEPFRDFIKFVINLWKATWQGAFDWFTLKNPASALLAKVGGWAAQSQREVRANSDFANMWGYPSTSAGGGGVQVNVTTGDLSIGVPEGTTEQQKQAISDSASQLIKLGFMNEVQKKFTSDLLLVTRR